MASNRFGKYFSITTWGESHGPAIGVVIDGCPAGIAVQEDDINTELALRAPGNSPFTSPRREPDRARILSGIFQGKTTGAPINIQIDNQDADSSAYAELKDKLRPGHANATYLQKYGLTDHRGGGRASARETAARVASGAIARRLLNHYDISVVAYLKSVGPHQITLPVGDVFQIAKAKLNSPIFCPDNQAEQAMIDALFAIQAEGDSLGGIVGFKTNRLPTGLGDPIYEKCEARLAYAMLSIPASKGFEIGSGFQSSYLKGSEHNDRFLTDFSTATNYAGGILGGISNGMEIEGSVAFKPTSSIRKKQKTVDVEGRETTIELGENARHDPCVAVRAVPVVEAMCCLVLSDFIISNKGAKL